MEEQRKDDYNKKLMYSQARKKRDMQEELKGRAAEIKSLISAREDDTRGTTAEEEMRVHELMAVKKVVML